MTIAQGIIEIEKLLARERTDAINEFKNDHANQIKNCKIEELTKTYPYKTVNEAMAMCDCDKCK